MVAYYQKFIMIIFYTVHFEGTIHVQVLDTNFLARAGSLFKYLYFKSLLIVEFLVHLLIFFENTIIIEIQGRGTVLLLLVNPCIPQWHRMSQLYQL